MSESRDLIRALQERGYSQRQIARAIGRNDSLISQIARGKKPGGNLTDSLRELARRPGVSAAPVAASPPRRTTRTGELARVRGGLPAVPRITGTPADAGSTAGIAQNADGRTVAWSVAGFAFRGGSSKVPTYVDLQAGDTREIPETGEMWITFQIGEGEYRQARVILTRDFTLADAAAALVEQYG